ncbi:hydrogenase expression/formation protein HypE [Verrucomicrobiota bacterium]
MDTDTTDEMMSTQTRGSKDDVVLLAHGGGGLRTKELIKEIMLRHLGNPILERLDDGACLSIPESELVFTTDSYVVDPIFFPGGDIGMLAACGTINDLAMQGAEPRYLSFGLILEEGFPIRDLERIVKSLAEVTKRTGMQVVTGDTKVVEQGKGAHSTELRTGGVFINTSGIGIRREDVDVHIGNARPGDVVIITGPIGNHGAAIMCAREEGLRLETDLVSDVAPLWELINPLLSAVPNTHCLRDPTRGGIASALCDIAETAQVGIRLRESDLPVRKEVRGVCQLLGLDPLNVANEGNALVLCAQADAETALRVLQAHALGKQAVAIGTAVPEPSGMVLLETELGGERIVETPMGEDLPRIC